jgi:peptide/nickel transport system permease protein
MSSTPLGARRADPFPSWWLSRGLVEQSPWIRYVLGRLTQGIVVILGAAIVSFALIHISGDPATVLAGGMMPAEQVRLLSHQLGYDRPLPVQFGDYMWHLVRGDLGESFRFHQSAAALVLEALPRTLLLVFGAIGLATAVALPVSIFSVLNRESISDRLIRRSLIVGQGIPEFWLGLVLILIFAARLNWLPSLGFNDWKSPILPIITLALPLCAILTRLLRIQLLDIMGLEFVIALRAKGLTEPEILFHHALLNALIPFVTFLALQIGWLVGGTLVVEAVFTWPGLGVLALSSVKTRDLQVLQAIVILVALVFVVGNLIADLIVLWIDPRIRVGRARQ